MAEFGHSDAPVRALAEDSLGIAPYAMALADFIRRCDTPMTVAIQGDWGTGKTSLMHLVQESLRSGAGAARIETVWFATWQYSQFGATASLSVSLLSALLRQIGGSETGLLNSGLNILRKLAKPAINIGLRAATGGMVEADDLSGGGSGNAVDLACNAEDLKQEIAELIAAKRSKGTERIVVFVDDLDRVPPERAVEILETIKLFVDLEGCVFVLALDYAVVSRGLKQKFGVGEAELDDRSFFDKIIQLPFSIPTARHETDRFIRNLFERMKLPMEPEDGDLFANLARASVSVNPRGIKRVFNSLQLLIEMARAQALLTGKAQTDRLMVRNLFALLCMQNRFEAIHDWLVFNAERLDGAMVRRLAGEGDSEQDDARLMTLLAELKEDRARQFGEFARIFVDAVQDPGGSADDIDDAELGRLRSALKLTRVTGVGEVTAPALANDREFRSQNRELMKRLKMKLDAESPDSSRATRVSQPHTESGIYVWRKADQSREFDLTLYHGETVALISISGTKKQMAAKGDVIRSALAGEMPAFDDNDPYKTVLWREEFDTASFAGREDFLLTHAIPRFLKAEAALVGKLD